MSVSAAAAAPGAESWHTQHAQALASENRRLRADVLDLKATIVRQNEELERWREWSVVAGETRR